MSRILYMAFAIVVAVCGLAFHVRNNQRVVLDYFVGRIETELSVALVGALVLGAVLAILATTATLLRLKREVRRLNRRNELATRELASLRAVSADDAR